MAERTRDELPASASSPCAVVTSISSMTGIRSSSSCRVVGIVRSPLIDQAESEVCRSHADRCVRPAAQHLLGPDQNQIQQLRVPIRIDVCTAAPRDTAPSGTPCVPHPPAPAPPARRDPARPTPVRQSPTLHCPDRPARAATDAPASRAARVLRVDGVDQAGRVLRLEVLHERCLETAGAPEVVVIRPLRHPELIGQPLDRDRRRPLGRQQLKPRIQPLNPCNHTQNIPYGLVWRVGWRVRWSASWRGRVVGELVGRLFVRWSVGWCVSWCVGWGVSRCVTWCVSWSVGWCAGWWIRWVSWSVSWRQLVRQGSGVGSARRVGRGR